MKKCVSVILVLCLLLGGCARTQPVVEDESLGNLPVAPVNLSAGTRVWIAEELAPTDVFKIAQTALALNLLKSTTDQETKNPLLAPYSVSVALALAANGAEGETEERLLKVLGASSVEELNGMLYNRKRNENGSVISAQSVWVKNLSDISEEYLENVKDHYNADVYRGIEQNAINSWVKEKTGGQIESLECDTTADVQLLNAMTFQSSWAQFLEEKAEGTFNDAAGKAHTVTMMKGKAEKYATLNGGEGFVKYYADSTVAFAAFLPPEGVSVYDYVRALTAEELLHALETSDSTEVKLTMPSFEANADLTLTDAVKALGLAEDFTPAADFPAFGSVYLSEIKQKAVLEVDQNGTRGAASTTAGMVKYDGDPEYKELVLDRPFVYTVFDVKTNAPLFLGAVTNF